MWNVEPRYLPYQRGAQDRASAGLAGAAQPGAVGEHREVRRGRHVRQGLRRQVDQGRHRRRRRRSSSRSTRRSRRMTAVARAGGWCAGARAFSFGRWLEREGVFSWLMLAPPVALPARVRRLSVLLRHLAQPAGPAGGQAGRVRRPRQLRHRLARPGVLAGRRATPSSTPPPRRS